MPVSLLINENSFLVAIFGFPIYEMEQNVPHEKANAVLRINKP